MDIIVNNIFRFAYPVAFIGAILFSIGTFISIDFLSIIFNKNMLVFLNVYIALCGYIAFCTFFRIQVEINGYVIDFDNIYVSYDHLNTPYEVAPGQTEISLTG